MKSLITMWTTTATLLAALAMPICVAAQNSSSPDHRHKHKKYRLIDMGTFGGPSSDLTTNDGDGAGARVLNSRGALIGSSDTAIHDPYNPDCPDCFVGHAFLWDDGVLRDLGSLPGVNSSQGTGINDHGLAVGLSQNGEIDPILGAPAAHAVLWRNRRISDLGTLGGYESNAASVNDAGDVTGFSTVPGPLDPYSFLGQSIHAFFWRNGVMQDVGTLGGPDTFPGYTHQITGVVVGASFTNSTPNPTTGIPTLHPFFWRDGQMRDLGTLGGTLCYEGGFVVNRRGQVASDSTLVGDLQTHPFFWDRGILTDIGTLGGDNGFVFGMNNDGEVVGNADLPGSQTHDAFLWRRSAMTDLGNLGRTSSAYAVNSHSQVVGASRISDTPGDVRAFLWENGGPMVDLNDLIPRHSPLLLAYAVNINDHGDIAGLGVPDGCAPPDYLACGRAYLLIPDGDWDEDNETRVDERQATADLVRQNPPATTERSELPLSPGERFRSMMRQRYLPGQRPLPRD
jgi:probable HAF family extracellular repeat protein